MNSATLSPAESPAATDAELVARVLGGDARVFAGIMRANNRRLFRTARSILGDDAEAEDAVQEGYISAYRALARFEGASSLSTWLTRIVANAALGRLRQRTRRNGREEASGDPPAEPAAAPTESPEALAMRRELRRVIEGAIDRLPESCRAVFMLRAVEELSVAETAHCLGLSEAAVKTALFRARRHLRDTIGRELQPLPGDFFAFAGARCERIVATVLARLGLAADAPPPA